MKVKTINRRKFLKATVACCVMTQYLPAISFGKNIENDFRLKFDTDSEFVVVNGWVLLKSDLTLINGK